MTTATSMERTMKTLTTMFCVALNVATSHAHDASLHHDKPTSGTIESIQGDQLRLVTPTGIASMTLDPTTKLEVAGRPTTRDVLKPGVAVEVFGTKLPGGEVAAREIHVHTAGDNAAPPDTHDAGPPEQR